MSCVRLFVCAFFREGGWRQAVVVAGAAGRYSALQDRGLCAGEMFRLAGFSSGPGVGARGAGRRGDAVLLKCFELGLCLSYVSIEMFCVWITPAVCVSIVMSCV